MRHWSTRYIFLVIGVILIISLLSCGKREVDCLKVENATFQEEVIESQMPVLVVFCNDEIWNRDRWRYSPEYGLYVQPSPVVLAIKEIIQSGQYENRIKFCRYYMASRSDPICVEYNIQWFPTTIVFRDGSVFWKAEGMGCTVEKEGVKIEGILKQVIDENQMKSTGDLAACNRVLSFVSSLISLT